MPFGGGGGLHAGALIDDCGLAGAIVPRFPGVTSALGCVIADIRHDGIATVNLLLDVLDLETLNARMAQEERAARDIVEAAGLAIERIDVEFDFDMHYVGQTHTVPVRVARPVSIESIRLAFEVAYARAFARLLPGVPMRLVSLRTAAIGRRPPFDLRALAPGPDASQEIARRGMRSVRFDGRPLDTSIWARLDLPVDAIVDGPAILEQPDATTIIAPGQRARVDVFGNLRIERL
jgi:N-methylhydantoinase A